jgi:parvulin-like peptidyl-prolyl isomerase
MRLVAGVCVLVLTGCPQTPPPASVPGVVARVDTMAVTAAELRAFVARLPAVLRSSEAPEGARREYIRSLMARHLLARQARADGIDSLPAVRARAQGRWQQHLIEVYRHEVLAPRVQVTEADIQRAFRAGAAARERQLAVIMVGSEAAAREVAARLQRGESFAGLARELSLDERSAAQGGVAGYVNADQARRLRLPPEVFAHLPDGRVSAPLPLGRRWQLVKFEGARTASLEEARPALERELRARKWEETEARAVQDLARQLHWRLVDDGLAALLQAAQGRRYLRPEDLDEGTGARALFAFDGGAVSVRDYVSALWTNPAAAVQGQGLADRAAVVAGGETLLVGELMLAEGARRTGLADRADLRRWLDLVTEEFAIRELRRLHAVVPAQVNETDAQEYYRAHEADFRRPMVAHIVEVLVATEPEARALRARLSGLSGLGELAAEYSLREDARANNGLLVVDDHMRLAHPRLCEAVRAAPLDQVVGPLPVEQGYTLFQVLRREGGESAPFAEVLPRARALVRKQRRDDLLRAYIDSLIAAMGDRVLVDDHELRAALPDSLLTAPVSGDAQPEDADTMEAP